MKQVSRLLLGGLILIGAYAAAAEPAIDEARAREEQYWKQITVKVPLASQLFDLHIRMPPITTTKTGGGCYESAEKFYSCVRAIQNMGAELTPNVTLLPSADLNLPQWAGARVLKNLNGKMALVEIPDSSADHLLKLKSSERIAEVQNARESILGVANDVVPPFAGLLKSQTNFSRIMAYNLPIDFNQLAQDVKAHAPADMVEAKLAVALMNGYLQGTDAHAHINLTKKLNEDTTNADQSLSGIGAEIRMDDGLVTVVNPISGGPSENILQSGDVILEADGTVLKNKPLKDVVDLYLRGIQNSMVTLKVRRGQEDKTIQITRAKIVIPNLKAEIVSDLGQKVGVLKLATFMDNVACAKMERAIKSMDSQVSSYVLDLRSDGGGDLSQAICIGGLFAGKQPIVYSKDLREGEVTTYDAPADAATQKPLVVLVNAGSASASEIVSGALQGLRRAWVVGDRSFGKATVQQGGPFQPDRGLTVFQTVARFYVPVLGADHSFTMRTNQRVGVVPDFAAPARPGLTEEERFSMREGDLYPQSLTAETTSWDQIRPQEAQNIRNCLDVGKKADAVYKEKPNSDYQMLEAEEVLSCQTAI